MDHTTNYRDTFITVSPDCPAMEGTVPPKPGTVAAMQHERLLAKPYSMTSDDLLFGIFADRNEIPAKERAVVRGVLQQGAAVHAELAAGEDLRLGCA